MKVLHLISGGDSGGAKTHVLTLLSALNEEIDVKVCCFMRGIFYQELEKSEIPSMLLEQTHRYDLSVVKKLVRHIHRERYNLIHVHGARANFIAVFLKRHIKIPIITTVHSDYKLDFTQGAYRRIVYTRLNSFALRFMDYYIAVSGSFMEMLAERGFDKNRIYTIYNSMNFDKKIEFAPKDEFLERYGIDHVGKTVVGIAGRFDIVKGHEMFLNAAAEVLKTENGVIFLLAGEGGERENLEKLAKQLNIDKNVYFLGFVNDIYSFYNAIDINVLASKSESFPYALLEGAAMRKATVSTSVGGIPDLIIDGRTGLLVKSGDAIEMKNKIIKLIESSSLRDELGANLLKYARDNFSTEVMKYRHLEIYNSIIKRQRENNELFDIALSGYYGFDNSGDNALLKAIIESVRREKPEIKILVLSKKTKEISKLHNVYTIYRFNLVKICKYLKRTRVFINGGGSLIQDITSTHSLVYYTYLMKLAKRLGLKVMIYANGIGPITKKLNEKRAGEALRLCDYVSLRDEESVTEYERLTENGGKSVPNPILSVDPAFSLDKADDETINYIFDSEGLQKDERYLALSFRSWKYNDTMFEEKMASSIDRISAELGLIPLYISMHPSDRSISLEIYEKSSAKGVVLKGFYDAEKIMGIISRTRMVISMRLHTLIYGTNVNVPVIGIVYDAKIRGLLDYINQKYYIDTKNIDCDKLVELAHHIDKNMPEIKKQIAQEMERLRDITKNDAKEAIRLID